MEAAHDVFNVLFEVVSFSLLRIILRRFCIADCVIAGLLSLDLAVLILRDRVLDGLGDVGLLGEG